MDAHQMTEGGSSRRSRAEPGGSLENSQSSRPAEITSERRSVGWRLPSQLQGVQAFLPAQRVLHSHSVGHLRGCDVNLGVLGGALLCHQKDAKASTLRSNPQCLQLMCSKATLRRGTFCVHDIMFQPTLRRATSQRRLVASTDGHGQLQQCNISKYYTIKQIQPLTISCCNTHDLSEKKSVKLSNRTDVISSH